MYTYIQTFLVIDGTLGVNGPLFLNLSQPPIDSILSPLNLLYYRVPFEKRIYLYKIYNIYLCLGSDTGSSCS